MALDNGMRDLFMEEVGETLAELDGALLELEKFPHDAELVNRIFRAVHTLKGACDMFGVVPVVTLAHNLESLFDHVRGGWRRVGKDLLDDAPGVEHRRARVGASVRLGAHSIRVDVRPLGGEEVEVGGHDDAGFCLRVYA